MQATTFSFAVGVSQPLGHQNLIPAPEDMPISSDLSTQDSEEFFIRGKVEIYANKIFRLNISHTNQKLEVGDLVTCVYDKRGLSSSAQTGKIRSVRHIPDLIATVVSTVPPSDHLALKFEFARNPKLTYSVSQRLFSEKLNLITLSIINHTPRLQVDLNKPSPLRDCNLIGATQIFRDSRTDDQGNSGYRYLIRRISGLSAADLQLGASVRFRVLGWGKNENCLLPLPFHATRIRENTLSGTVIRGDKHEKCLELQSKSPSAKYLGSLRENNFLLYLKQTKIMQRAVEVDSNSDSSYSDEEVVSRKRPKKNDPNATVVQEPRRTSRVTKSSFIDLSDEDEKE